MLKSQRSYLAAIVILAVLNSAAFGQTINLVCNGTMHQYEPNRTEGTTGGATTIDFERERIVTPVGHYRITKIEETKIYFDNPEKGYGEGGWELKVSGSLDRLTGKMTVLWRRPDEESKMQAGLPSKMSMYAELSCSVSKRLF